MDYGNVYDIHKKLRQSSPDGPARGSEECFFCGFSPAPIVMSPETDHKKFCDHCGAAVLLIMTLRPSVNLAALRDAARRLHDHHGAESRHQDPETWADETIPLYDNALQHLHLLDWTGFGNDPGSDS